MSFPEITIQYMFRKGKEWFREGHYQAAKNYLYQCAISDDLTFEQREEARDMLGKIKTNV